MSLLLCTFVLSHTYLYVICNYVSHNLPSSATSLIVPYHSYLDIILSQFILRHARSHLLNTLFSFSSTLHYYASSPDITLHSQSCLLGTLSLATLTFHISLIHAYYISCHHVILYQLSTVTHTEP